MSVLNTTARRAVTVAACAVVSGCVFVSPPESGEQAAEAAAARAVPDATAPRLPPLETRHFHGLPADVELIGELQLLFARHENTFTAIAREFGVGFEAMRRANPGVDQWLPGEGTPIYLPTQAILPDAPRDGIVVNLPSMRLYLFTNDGDAEDPRLSITTHAIGIGREGWATPLGSSKVTEKIVDPAWYPPVSVREEHAANGDPLPAVVPPGPDNPLGRHAMLLSIPGYLIHGTNRPSGVGMRVSSGCIRMYPEDIEALFERVPRGLEVHIVDQPALAGWHDGQLYLEVHPPLQEDERDLTALAHEAIAAALARAEHADIELDAEAIREAIEAPRGIPLPIGRSASPSAQTLASVRIVENKVPVRGVETAAVRD